MLTNNLSDDSNSNHLPSLNTAAFCADLRANVIARMRSKVEGQNNRFYAESMKAQNQTRVLTSLYGAFENAFRNMSVMNKFLGEEMARSVSTSSKLPASVETMHSWFYPDVFGDVHKIQRVKDAFCLYIEAFAPFASFIAALCDPVCTPTAHKFYELLDGQNNLLHTYKKKLATARKQEAAATDANEKKKFGYLAVIFGEILQEFDFKAQISNDVAHRKKSYREDISYAQLDGVFEVCRGLDPSNLSIEISTEVLLTTEAPKPEAVRRGRSGLENTSFKKFRDFLIASKIGSPHHEAIIDGLETLLATKEHYQLLAKCDKTDPTAFWNQFAALTTITPSEKLLADFAIAMLHTPPVVLACDSFISVLRSITNPRRARSTQLMNLAFLKANGDITCKNPYINWSFHDPLTIEDRKKILGKEAVDELLKQIDDGFDDYLDVDAAWREDKQLLEDAAASDGGESKQNNKTK